jgi:hypothetical protein
MKPLTVDKTSKTILIDNEGMEPYFPSLYSPEYETLKLAHLMNEVVDDPDRVVKSICDRGMVNWKLYSSEEKAKISKVRLVRIVDGMRSW